MHPDYKSGLRDWLVQRVTAVIILVYTLTLALMLFYGTPLAHWRSLFSTTWMQVVTLIVLLSVCWHAWIGLWTVLTDYVHHRLTRHLLELIIIAAMLFYVAWLVKMFWL